MPATDPRDARLGRDQEPVADGFRHRSWGCLTGPFVGVRCDSGRAWSPRQLRGPRVHVGCSPGVYVRCGMRRWTSRADVELRSARGESSRGARRGGRRRSCSERRVRRQVRPLSCGVRWGSASRAAPGGACGPAAGRGRDQPRARRGGDNGTAHGVRPGEGGAFHARGDRAVSTRCARRCAVDPRTRRGSSHIATPVSRGDRSASGGAAPIEPVGASRRWRRGSGSRSRTPGYRCRCCSTAWGRTCWISPTPSCTLALEYDGQHAPDARSERATTSGDRRT